MGRLQNHVVVITGASRGLGRALAIGLAREGAQTVLVARDPQALRETAKRVAQVGPEPVTAAADVGSAADVGRMRDAVLAAVTPTALINNASQFLLGPLQDVSPEAVAGVLQTGVVGSVLVTQAFLAALRKAPASLVLNVGARVAAPSAPLDVAGTSLAYQIAKRHLTLLASALRQEAPGLGVATLYLPAIGSLADLDDAPETVRRLYRGAPVLMLSEVVRVVADRLAQVPPVWEEWVLGPA